MPLWFNFLGANRDTGTGVDSRKMSGNWWAEAAVIFKVLYCQ